MLSRKYPFVALCLLLTLAGLLSVSAQELPQKKKNYKVKEVLTPGQEPRPRVLLSEHTDVITLCEGSTDAQIPLRATVENFSKPEELTYTWEARGGRIVKADGSALTGNETEVIWDLSGMEVGKTYSAKVLVENNREIGCEAFTTTKVVVQKCPAKVVLCPSINISAPDSAIAGTPVIFNATVSGGTPGVAPVYNWSVTDGAISSGQGTPSITVDTTGLAGQPITASISVEGFGLNCGSNYTVQLKRTIVRIPFDKYPPIRFNDEKARLDNFSIQLQNDPNAKGWVMVYGGPRATAAEKRKRVSRVRDYLTLTRGLDASRLVFKEGGNIEAETTTELWIVPLGADPPELR